MSGNDIEITVSAKDEGASQVAKKTGSAFSELGEKTDQMATKSSTAMGAFGALQSGIALTNQKSEERKQKLAAENEQITDQISKLKEQTDSNGKLSPAIQAQIDKLNEQAAANSHATAAIDASEQKSQGYINTLQSAAFAMDALSGVTDLATLAINSKVLTLVKDTAVTVAHTAVQGIAKAATATWTAAQWLLNVAMDANPIGLIILAIAALVAIIIVIATKTTWFQSIWKAVWDFLKGVGHWFAHDFVGFFSSAFDWIMGAVNKYYNFWVSVWSKIASVPRGAINAIIRAWNGLDFGVHVHIPSWVPGIGGMGIDINDIFPDIPYLAGGGIVKARQGGTLAVLGEGGSDEAVVPLNGMIGGGGTLRLDLTGAQSGSALDLLLIQRLQEWIRTGKLQLTG